MHKLETLSDSEDLWTMPVPELGFEIPDLCKIGLTLSYTVGYATRLLGSATMVLGVTSSISGDALSFIDPKSHHKCQFTGFERAASETIFDATLFLRFSNSPPFRRLIEHSVLR